MASDSSGSHAATSDAPLLSAPAHYGRSTIHRTRRALGLAFFVCAALVLTLTGCDSEAMLSADSTDRDTALRILQTDSRMLAFADIESQYDAATRLMGDDPEQMAMLEEGLERLYEMTGIRMEEDVHSVYVGMQDFSNAPRGGIVAFVDFDQNEVAEQAAELEGVVRLDSDWPVDAYSVESQDGGAAIAFAEGSLVLMATNTAVLRNMLDRAYQEEGTISMDPLLAEVADRDSWFVARGVGEFMDDLPPSGGSTEMALVRPLLGGIQDLAFGMDQDGESMSSQVLIRPNDTVTVDDYESLLSGVRAMLRLQVRDLDVASEMVNRIDIEADDDWVSLEMSMDREEMERLEDEIGSELLGRFN